MNTSGMTPIGRVEDLRRQRITAHLIDDASIVVVALGAEFRAVVNRCPHQQAEIFQQGTIDDGGLTCPLHGRTFDLTSGACRNGAGRLTFIPIAVVDGVVWAGPVPTPQFPAFV